MSQGPWTPPGAPDTHIWISELSPWCHSFVLLPTPCMVSIWNRKTITLVGILREKELIFTRVCCKYWKLESQLKFWTVVSKNEAPFFSYRQADQQLMRSSFRLEGLGLFVADWACNCADHRHFQHPLDHGWSSSACFLPWLTMFIFFPQFDFLGKYGNFLPPFTTAPASNIWWAVCICQLKLLAQTSSVQVPSLHFHVTAEHLGGLRHSRFYGKQGYICMEKMPLVSDFSKASFNFWWEMLKQNLGVSCRAVFQLGFSFFPKHPYQQTVCITKTTGFCDCTRLGNTQTSRVIRVDGISCIFLWNDQYISRFRLASPYRV